MAVPVTPPGNTQGLVGLRAGMGRYVPNPAPRAPVRFGSGSGMETPYIPPTVKPGGSPTFDLPIRGSGPGTRIGFPKNEIDTTNQTTPSPVTNPPPPTQQLPPYTIGKGNPNQHWQRYARKRRGLSPRTTTSVTPEMIRRAAAMRMSS
jgi:hypothetical protein